MHGNFFLLYPFNFFISALIKINVHDNNTCNVIDNDNYKVQQFSSRKKKGTANRKSSVSSVLLLMNGIDKQVKKYISSV